MIKELQMCQDGYEEMLEIYLRQIFIKLQRHFKSSLNSDNSHAFEEITQSLTFVNIIMNQLILMIMPKKIILVLVGLSVILNYTLGLHQNSIF